MGAWVLSQEVDKWSVKYDVRDLGGHLDTTFRGWSATLVSIFRLVISRLVLIFVLLLDFHGRIRVVRSMYLPAALHGVESSLLALEGLRKLRSSICRVVWSRRQPLASAGAVLSLLDGPTGCDLAFCVVGFRFRLLRRYLALCPTEACRVYRLLEMVSEGCLGMDLFTYSLPVLLRLGFGGIRSGWVGLGLGCLCLVIWLALSSISRLLFLMLGGIRLQLIFAVERVLGVGSGVSLFHVGSVVLQMVMVTFFWGRGECTFPPLVEIREHPEFHGLMRMDKAHTPRRGFASVIFFSLSSWFG